MFAISEIGRDGKVPLHANQILETFLTETRHTAIPWFGIRMHTGFFGA